MDGFERCSDHLGNDLFDEEGRAIYYNIETGMLGILEDIPVTPDLQTQTASSGESEMIERNSNTRKSDVLDSTALIAPMIVEDSPACVADKQVAKSADDRFDAIMTGKLIEEVSKKFVMLNDKSHVKKKVWEMIAEDMQKLGYLKEFDKGKAGEKCHQRWRNLEKMYHNHIKYTKSTGKEKKKEPAFFEDMHGVIGEKHSSKPALLLDTICDDKNEANENKIETNEISSQSSDSENLNSPKLPDKSETKKNIFHNVQRSVRPKKESIASVLKELQQEDLNLQSKNFDRIEKLLVEQNELRKKSVEQRDTFLSIMKDLAKSDKRKNTTRKRKYSEDSD